MHVLLVEDNEMNRDMLSRRLARRGLAVTVAVDGAEAVRLAKAARPDLILMDIGLPVIDGWEAIRQIKTTPDTSAIPILALTAHAFSEDRDRALAAGCIGFIPKPIDMSALLVAINSAAGTGTLT